MLEDPHEDLEQLDPLHVQLDTGHFQFLLKKKFWHWTAFTNFS